jgi:quercetin dioxygenase-like cupin family protein
VTDDHSPAETNAALNALLAQSLTPTRPDAAREEALRARILSAVAAASVAASESYPYHFVARADRRWEQRRMGVEFCLLHEDDFSRTFLLRLQPGGVLPAHTHDIDEESLMLEGDAWIGDLRYLMPGDFHFVPAGTPHPDLRSPRGCVVYVRGAKRFKPNITPSLLGRLLRDFLGRP